MSNLPSSPVFNGPIYERDGDIVLYVPVPGVLGRIMTAPRIDAAKLRQKLESWKTCRGTVASLIEAPPVAAFAPVTVAAGETYTRPSGFALSEAMGLTAGFAALAQLAREV